VGHVLGKNSPTAWTLAKEAVMTLSPHAIDRMRQRDIWEREVRRAVARGQRLQAKDGRIKVMLNGIIVVIEAATNWIITVYWGRPQQLKEFSL